LSGDSLLVRGKTAHAGTILKVSYPYLCLLFSAGIHTNEGTHSYFWGKRFCFAWPLGHCVSAAFGIIAWLGALVLVVGWASRATCLELERLLEVKMRMDGKSHEAAD